MLVDTSTLLSFLDNKSTSSSLYLENWINEGGEFFLTGVIVQEILQGVRDKQQWALLNDYLSCQQMLEPRCWLDTYKGAASIYFDCRKKGITIRSGHDCFIAQLAIEYNMPLLHEDRDYEKIRIVRPLETFPKVTH